MKSMFFAKDCLGQDKHVTLSGQRFRTYFNYKWMTYSDFLYFLKKYFVKFSGVRVDMLFNKNKITKKKPPIFILTMSMGLTLFAPCRGLLETKGWTVRYVCLTGVNRKGNGTALTSHPCTRRPQDK